jgi:hypothetical protein
MGTDLSTATTVRESMAAQERAVTAKQTAERSKARPPAAKPSSHAKPAPKAKPAQDSPLAILVAWRASTDAPEPVLDVVDAAIRRGTGAPRSVAPKADPKVVASFFKSTGLSPKQIAAAVGVSTSVIGTVQRENGDRWSVVRFEAAKPLIVAAAKKLSVKAK